MTYGPQEIEAYAQMQARLVSLILRYDEQRFGRYYAERAGYSPERDEALEPYRELAVLFALRDELFEHILPRIVRRLSFESPRATVVEEPPPRGRVDWERTLDSTWAERPGEPPLLLQTRQRRRDFATPENLLAVVTLLEYAADVHRLLWGEYAAVGAEALRHPLAAIAARCERELAFPQFAGIRGQAQHIIDQHETAALEAQVAERLIPGANSAYEELLAWRARYRSLRLLHRSQHHLEGDVLGADPDRDSYLYQLWLYYELIDLLSRDGALQSWDRETTEVVFRWGAGDSAQLYRLQHDRAIPDDLRVWRRGPGVRPDLYICRLDRQEVRDDDGALIWREPGYLLDAKYYRPHDDDPKAPAGPIKRMIADLQLTGERYGALLFAFQGTAPEAPGERVAPEWRKAQLVAPDSEIRLYQIRPQGAADSQPLERALRALLDDVHERLRERVPVRCHGVFLDTLTANAHGRLAGAVPLHTRYGALHEQDLSDLLLCPKPHVAPWRVDLVSVTRDCCANPALCHIARQPGVAPPRRLTALEEIAEALRHTAPGGEDEDVATAATEQVMRITRRYAQLLQPRIDDYRQWIRERLEIDDLFDTTPLLTDVQRETLALGRFLWEQIEQIRASNFAGPVLLFTGVLEEVSRVTIYKHSPPLCDTNGRPLMRTLGTIGNCKGYGGRNWLILEDAIARGGHWDEQVTPHQRLPLSDWVDMVQRIASIRNDAAHKAHVERGAFQTLVTLYFGSARTGLGALNGLLLAWRA
ncbi:MAG: hypothetical protein DIU80_006885 [Chloroflexota bacterium]|mgnify:CR=1 FL=1|nr:MAG: hypothetical protein DIU80_03920 [Chloroflexota bacterium]